MRKSLAKSARLRLDADSYRKLHRQVLQRDGWRCQVCGRMQRLQVHHLSFRSHSGSDVEQNLITVCAECHARLHPKAKAPQPTHSRKKGRVAPALSFIRLEENS
jgi:5-methylcytosine-specific restriction endonuclease McrA